MTNQSVLLRISFQVIFSYALETTLKIGVELDGVPFAEPLLAPGNQQHPRLITGSLWLVVSAVSLSSLASYVYHKTLHLEKVGKRALLFCCEAEQNLTQIHTGRRYKRRREERSYLDREKPTKSGLARRMPWWCTLIGSLCCACPD